MTPDQRTHSLAPGRPSPSTVVLSWLRLAKRVLTSVATVGGGLLTSRSKRRNRRSLLTYRNLHRGKRCVIVGNGPSLNATDLSLLQGEFVFGLNRWYLMRDRLGFEPAFHVVVNKLVVEQTTEDLAELTVPLFTTYGNRRYLQERPSAHFLNSLQVPKFHRNASFGVWEGSTVTFVAMQLAYFMGFEEVVLIGVDHNFSATGPAHKEVVSGGADADHFDPNYFGSGFRWQLPDLETSEIAYRLAKRAFEADGRRIVDATVGGKLQVFDKVDLAEALA